MSRKEESTVRPVADLQVGEKTRALRFLDPYKADADLRQCRTGWAPAAALPAVALAAEGGEVGLPEPSLGAVLDGVGMVATHFPLGGVPGFALAVVATGGLGYLHLKQKFDLGKSGPLNAADKVGFATPRELRKWLSPVGLRARAGTLRPSLANLRPREISPHDLGFHVGIDLLHKRGLYISCEDTLLTYAPPRSGKSAQFGNAVIDAAGACIVATTRGDLYEHTHTLRAQHNRPIWVFNAGVSGAANTLRWNLVEGCENPAVAVRRAGYILAASATGSDMENGSFWEGHAFNVLSSYLMAAAFAGGDLTLVRSWVTNSTDDRAWTQLRKHSDRVPAGWAEQLRQVMDAPERTRDSVYLTLIRSFEFMSLPGVVDIVSPRPGGQRFDVADFLNSRGTLYLMGRDQRFGSPAPLFNALVGEIYEEAYQRADNSPGGRLDPYMRMVLDEAAVICPLPLHQWSADAGGRNIQMLISVQSPSQLRERWGRHGAQTIVSNSSRLVLGGLSVPEDLEDISVLCGEKDQEVATSSNTDDDKRSRSTTTRRVRVMPPEAVRTMKEGTGLVFYRHLPPIRYRFTPVWQRKDVRELAKQEAAQAKQEAKMKKAGVQVTGPVLPPQMPGHAPVAQQPGEAPTIPNQAPAADDRRWTA